jgi:hypothetical protein
MTTWNYRLVCSPDVDEEGWFEICEVYYKNGKPWCWCEVGTPCGDSVKSVKSDLRNMAQAFKLPILDVKTVRGKNKLVERKEC